MSDSAAAVMLAAAATRCAMLGPWRGAARRSRRLRIELKRIQSDRCQGGLACAAVLCFVCGDVVVGARAQLWWKAGVAGLGLAPAGRLHGLVLGASAFRVAFPHTATRVLLGIGLAPSSVQGGSPRARIMRRNPGGGRRWPASRVAAGALIVAVLFGARATIARWRVVTLDCRRADARRTGDCRPATAALQVRSRLGGGKRDQAGWRLVIIALVAADRQRLASFRLPPGALLAQRRGVAFASGTG